MSELEILSKSNYLFVFFAVLIALAGLVILASKLVEAVRIFKKPLDKKETSLENHQEACERRFNRDKQELDNHRQRIEALEAGQRVQCQALHALLEHAIHNGNTDEMKEASKELFNHMNGGAVR